MRLGKFDTGGGIGWPHVVIRIVGLSALIVAGWSLRVLLGSDVLNASVFVYVFRMCVDLWEIRVRGIEKTW